MVRVIYLLCMCYGFLYLFVCYQNVSYFSDVREWERKSDKQNFRCWKKNRIRQIKFNIITKIETQKCLTKIKINKIPNISFPQFFKIKSQKCLKQIKTFRHENIKNYIFGSECERYLFRRNE